ncbi:cytochrome P450 [Amycolatopsis sp. DSM 110486]|uniref:cytochrome P450 n=1 Tax=Amycolatopsis sp. DSM 110486 TaxID=2865832 RepID=UPI001C69D01B|nr:cytochrome P450 [Amycolatopsis sp. DSM 110486]QYN25028.1 cytochrome P450 [Amycolatopsis sp. DSM 110486]
MTTAEELELPVARKCPFAPPEEYTQIREEQPITRVKIPDGKEAWVVSRHEDVRTVLNDRRFSSDRFNPNFPILVKGGNVFRQTNAERTMITMDAPEHGPARKSVLGEFTVKRVNAMRPRIQEIVDGLLDEILASEGPVDLVEKLSLPVPSLVICELLGVPYSEHDFFQENTAKLLKRTVSFDERRAAFERVRGYLGRLITTKEADPGKTLDAVEELLRYFTIVDTATARVAVEDVELDGVTIRAGEGVLALGYTANWDPAVFDEPSKLDITRGARHHVAFGFGPHQCLGQNLARAELQIVFDTLFRRIPTLRLAVDVDDLPFKEDASIYGLYRLPVTW